MAMIGTDLATAIKTAINSIPESNRSFDNLWNAIGSALIAYITSHAVITGSAVGVTAGGATVPVTSTIS